MAASFPDRRRPDRHRQVLTLALLVTAPLWAAQPRGEKGGPVAGACAEPISVDADHSDGDLRAGRMTYYGGGSADVTISQCDLRIQAQKVVYTSTRGKDSLWEFSDAVRLTFETGNLSAVAASVTAIEGRITRAQAQGSPAEFEQKLDSLPRPVHGRATNIDFDIPAQTIRLTGDVHFNDGRNESTSSAVLYNIRDQSAKLEASPGGRINMTIRPEGAGDAPQAPAPGPPGSQK